MKEYKPLQIKKYSKKSYKNPEARRFKRFKEEKSMELKMSCTDVKICAGNHNLATFFVFDHIYHFDLVNEKMNTKYPFSTESITCGNVRKDGKLIYSGLVNGKVNVYDANKKNLLRSYNSHKLQVNSIDIADNLVNFLTTSNDLSLKVFDLAGLYPVQTYDKAHGDYIKTAKYIDENTFLSGGYDKVVKLWDTRSKSAVQTFKNTNACNDMLILNSKEKFITTSDNYLNLFDIRNSQPILQANPVQSGISKLVTNDVQSRLFLVCPNENFVKVLDIEALTLRSLYTIKMGKEVCSFDISKDMNRYAVGFNSGEISIRSRNIDEDEDDVYQDQEDKDFELLE
jgi:WD40 repeat protein